MGYISRHSRVARRAAALGATDIPTLPPEDGAPQPPIYPLVQGGHGGYLEVRASPADGSCGVGSYPCKHPGLDVYGPQGTPVVAPESGVVVAVANGASSPWGGYGPWLIVIQGEGGKFHLLAHLDPNTSDMATMGQQVKAGDQVGTTSSANHTHWEVREKLVPDYAHGETGFDIIEDPVLWLAAASLTSGSIGSIVVLGVVGVFIWMLYKRGR